jgi:hypothetical protein
MKKKELAIALAFVGAVSAACIRVMRLASDALAREGEKRDREQNGK